MVPEDERGVSACLRRVRLSGTSRDRAPANQSQRAQSQLLLDLFAEDDRLISNDVGNVKTHRLRSGRRSRLS